METRPSEPQSSSLRRLIQLCVRHPLSCIILLHCLLVALALLRLMPNFPSFSRLVLDNGWDDGRTFFNIAFQGYRALPLYEYRELIGYPLAARAAALLLGHVPATLFAVSILCSLLCNLLIFSILRSGGVSSAQSLAGAVFFIVLRTPETLWAWIAGPYPPMELLVSIEGSEPLFLLLVLLSWRQMRRERHLPAALYLALATLVRLHGAFVAFGAFLYLLAARRPRAAFLYALSPLALLLHFAFYYHISGDFLAFTVASRSYYREGVFGYPFFDLIAQTASLLRTGSPGPHYLFRLVFQAWFVIGFVLLARRDRRLFCLMLPMYLVTVCMKEWSHHVRYYIVLWGVNTAWFLALLDLLQRGRRRQGLLSAAAPASSKEEPEQGPRTIAPAG